ncbi:Uncharacterised protein [Klebsiella pneumoniae]|uniref:Uncharacterized protein n=1 Tax=Klebsiella pneumoniae TaxID=573 RepID=A0A2X3FDL3_KLEPN|nr:Uncharacterised protein [Klebsiella pneumoniae]
MAVRSWGLRRSLSAHRFSTIITLRVMPTPGGYDLKVTDNIKKTEMVLIRPSAVRSLGMGNYLGGDVVPQGDTFVFEPAIGRLRAVVGRTAGTAESRLDVAMDTGKFHLAFFDVSGEAVQVHKMVSGQLVSGALTAVTARAIPSPAKPIMVARANNTMTDFLGSVDIAMTGVWSGTNLTAAQKQDMCNVIMEMYGDNPAAGVAIKQEADCVRQKIQCIPHRRRY